MIKPTPHSNGIGGLALLFCLVALIAGVLFDFLSQSDGGFALASQPGSRAVLGAAAAVAVVLVAHGVRLVLRGGDKGEGGDANHP